MNLVDIHHAEAELQKLYAVGIYRLGDDQVLTRMQPLLTAAGNPHTKLRAVHVAGTSGKTSTCYYAAALLHATGAHVGLSVSPHVDSITERLQVDGQPISEHDFCERLGEFIDIIHGSGVQPSYFELMITFVLWYFAAEGVDYVVLETGMGGLYDATNTVTRPDKVCVITDIGYDHMHVLGTDIASIATQKAGIIHQHNHLFMHEQDAAITEVITKRVAEQNAILNTVSIDQYQKCAVTLPADMPQFQKRNWCLARATVEHIAARDGLGDVPILNPSSVIVPGRMEIEQLPDGSTLILDGGHNGQKVAAFVSSFMQLYPDVKADVLLAMKKGKEYRDVLQNLQPITNALLVTAFTDAQDFPIRSQDPETIAAYGRSLGIDTGVESDNKRAFAQLKRSSARLKIVIGSIYLLGQIRS